MLFYYGDSKTKDLIDGLWKDQIDFLFKYFFTESKELREKMRDKMLREYESTIKEIEHIAEKIQMLNLQYREFLSNQEDIKNFMKDM